MNERAGGRSQYAEHLTRLFAGEIDKLDPDIPKGYMLNHTVCDFAETVRWWMRSDGYSAEDVSRFFLATTPFQ